MMSSSFCVRSRFLTVVLSTASLGLMMPTAWAQGGDTPGVPKPTSPAAKGAKKPDVAKAARARDAYKAGEEKLQAGDITGALSEYQKANETLPSPAARYKIALCFDKLGKTTEAADAYRALLAEPPPEDMAEQSKEAEARLVDLTTASVKVTTTVPVEATVRIDGASEGARTPATIRLKPGKHALEVSASGYEPAIREVDVIAGGSGELSLELTPIAPPVAVALPPAPVAVTPRPEPPPSKVPAYVTLGVAGAGAVVGTIFGIRALSARSDFNERPTTPNADKAEQSALIADMAFGVAITLGITGAVLLLSKNEAVKDPATPKTSRVRVPATRTSFQLTPLVTPHTQGAAATFRF